MKKYIFLFSIMLFLFNGCATVPKTTDLTESLKSRADEYWKLRLQDRYDETYGMEDATDLPSLAEYRNQAKLIKKFKIESLYVDKVEVDGTKGFVTVRLLVSMPAIPVPVKDVFQEDWVLQNGEWKHRFRLN